MWNDLLNQTESGKAIDWSQVGYASVTEGYLGAATAGVLTGGAQSLRAIGGRLRDASQLRKLRATQGLPRGARSMTSAACTSTTS